ncbi:DUF1492 domain-containing protein [Loigolactobacillus bifermentans]|nr:DUF1492 domain-containing protein [Loigolactobacillus bifermentans]
MLNVGLLPVLNTNKTEDNVRNFLINEFPRFVVKAGYSMVDVKSPRFSALPKSEPVGNGIEDALVEHADAPRIVTAAVNAIRRCPDKYQKILYMAYILELTDDEIIEQVPYERSQYYRLKSEALRWFADAFENTFDLHVYVRKSD